jgi:hypothetical protein
MPSIDLDAVIAKRQEASGSIDTFTFTFAEREWTCKDPVTADDEWKSELEELQTDWEVAQMYLGDKQYAEFLEAGGRAGYVTLAIRAYTERMASRDRENRPTRRSTSSRKATRKR